MNPSNVVDLSSPTANMYGCEPCPKCKGKYRFRLNRTPNVINCDDCGHEEPALLARADDDETDYLAGLGTELAKIEATDPAVAKAAQRYDATVADILGKAGKR